jgi:DNA polymerase-3 subunit gamma/tau
MPTQALYNKWRGQTFDDILGQEHITTTLRNQIKAGRIGHAYLFAGLRGTGKTSTARILAKAVNCIGQTDNPPCNQCSICRSITEGRSLDLIEIDGASNRGIDEIRDLRDKVAFAPSECRYKVYVIDEVHMLTNEAFNALLKTLEEPPAHAIFILCTTEPHRLPDTVLSRCQRFDFRRGPLPVILQKLRLICENEGIKISDEALEMIARRAMGSFRDAESLLDQLAAYGLEEITLEQVRGILGVAPPTLIGQLARCLISGDVPTGMRLINQALDNGIEPHQFLTEILDYLRGLMLLSIGGEDGFQSFDEETLAEMRRLTQEGAFSLDTLVRAIKLFNDAGLGLRTAARPQLSLELAFLEAANRNEGGASPEDTAKRPAPMVASEPVPAESLTQQAPADRATSLIAKTAPSQPPHVGDAGLAQPPKETVEELSPPYTSVASPSIPDAGPRVQEKAGPEGLSDAGVEGPSVRAQQLTLDWVRGKWQQVLMRMKALDPKLRAILNSVRPIEVHGDTITLGCEASFHRDRLVEEKRREIVERVLSEVMGVTCHIRCVVDKGQRETAKPGQAKEELFPPKEGREEARRKLLDHPVVKELEKRGGQISKVSFVEEEKENDSGQQG